MERLDRLDRLKRLRAKALNIQENGFDFEKCRKCNSAYSEKEAF